MAQQDRNTPQNQPPLTAPAPAPAGNPDLAAQLVALIKQDKNVALAVGQALSSTAEGRQMLGISGKPRQKRKPDADEVKRFVASYGEVQHYEGFKPVPPEGIVSKGPQAVAAWELAWEEGRHISPFDEAALSEGAILASHN